MVSILSVNVWVLVKLSISSGSDQQLTFNTCPAKSNCGLGSDEGIPNASLQLGHRSQIETRDVQYGTSEEK
jgi:hypothetical protein